MYLIVYTIMQVTVRFSCVLLVKGKIAQEFKEKTGPNMFGILQKHVKNGHINGSEV